MPPIELTIATQAPGKLVLFGEYAVLEGGTALVASVNRFARCVAVPADSFALTAPGFGVFNAETLHTAPPILQAIFAVYPPPDAHIELDSRQLYVDGDPDGCKLGLGSSAAVSTALLKALFRLAGAHPSLEHIFTAAHTTHYGAQGLGSGLDIAAAVFGGVFEYQLCSSNRTSIDASNVYTASAGQRVAYIRQCPNEATPIILGVHLGQAASTPKFVRAVHVLKTNNTAKYDAYIQSLDTISRRACLAWACHDIDALVQCCAENNSTLKAFGQEANVPIVPLSLEALNTRLKPLDSIAKTTGAGGGDMAWVVCRGEDHACAIEQSLSHDWSVYRFSTSPISERPPTRSISDC